MEVRYLLPSALADIELKAIPIDAVRLCKVLCRTNQHARNVLSESVDGGNRLHECGRNEEDVSRGLWMNVEERHYPVVLVDNRSGELSAEYFMEYCLGTHDGIVASVDRERKNRCSMPKKEGHQ